jgi:tetratricopeptide (TPR) repeat protein
LREAGHLQSPIILSRQDSDENNTWIMVVKIILDDLVELVGGLKRAIALFLWASLLVTPVAISQGTASAQSQGDDLASQSKWPEAAAQYSLVVKANPSNGYAWYSLGECLLQMKKFDEAAAAENNAITHHFRPLLSQVSLTRIAAAKGDRETALRIVKEISSNPQAPGIRSALVSATELKDLRADPRYKQIYASMVPCRAPEYRQFDFWIGDWEVRLPGGQVAGTNDVTLEQEGCLIVEHWKSVEGVQTGTSFNYYDIRDKKWHQLYLDNSGNAGAFPAMSGTFQDGKMVLLTGEKEGPVSRWTWYVAKPGTVRQLAEQTSDGKNWNATWDSTYVKRSSTAVAAQSPRS